MNDSPGKPGPAADVDPLTVFDPAKREPDLRAITRIVLRPIGSPMPLGFFTVAIDSVLVSALQWGLLPAVDRRHATHGSLAMQLRDIERQPGVRRTL